MSRRQGRFPCGTCRGNCFSEYLLCGTCKQWYHAKCQNLTKNELASWADVTGDYVCMNRRTVDGTEFDFFMGIQRLDKVCLCYYKWVCSCLHNHRLNNLCYASYLDVVPRNIGLFISSFVHHLTIQTGRYAINRIPRDQIHCNCCQCFCNFKHVAEKPNDLCYKVYYMFIHFTIIWNK